MASRPQRLAGDDPGGARGGTAAPDKKLADTQIQVSTTGNIVELKGIVRDLEQKRRALDLAESTTGAEKATDALEIAAP